QNMTNFQNAELVATPGGLAGVVGVSVQSRLWGADTNLRYNAYNDGCLRVDALAGARYLGLDESVLITENLLDLNNGNQFLLADRFATRNRFWGGQVGAQAEYHWGPWVLSVQGKFGMGDTHQTAYITGATVSTPLGGAPTTTPGGLLALQSNI